MGNLYIFLDEAGDFEFSRKGSKYFILTSVTTDNIMPLATELYNLKHDLISNSRLDIEYFHAHKDSWLLETEFFHSLQGVITSESMQLWLKNLKPIVTLDPYTSSTQE